MKYFTPFLTSNHCKLVIFWPIFKICVPKVIYWFWKSDKDHLVLHSCVKNFKISSKRLKMQHFLPNFGVFFTTKNRKTAFSRQDTHRIFSFGYFCDPWGIPDQKILVSYPGIFFSISVLFGVPCYCATRDKGERVLILGEGRKGFGRLLIQTKSVYRGSNQLFSIADKRLRWERFTTYVNVPRTSGLSLHKALSAPLYLQSDSTTMPLADAKISGPHDAFEKRLLNSILFELIEKRWHNIQFQQQPFCNASGPLSKFKSSHQSRGRIVNKVTRICLVLLSEQLS